MAAVISEQSPFFDDAQQRDTSRTAPKFDDELPSTPSSSTAVPIDTELSEISGPATSSISQAIPEASTVTDQKELAHILHSLGFHNCKKAAGRGCNSEICRGKSHHHEYYRYGGYRSTRWELKETYCNAEGEVRLHHLHCSGGMRETLFSICLEEMECGFSSTRGPKWLMKEHVKFKSKIRPGNSTDHQLKSLMNPTPPKPAGPPNVIVHLIRHAQAEHNIKQPGINRFEIRDPLLTLEGRAQCASLRDNFVHNITHVLTSPMRRTLQTTDRTLGELIRQSDLQVIADPALCEWGSSYSSMGTKDEDLFRWMFELGMLQNMAWDLIEGNWELTAMKDNDRNTSPRAVGMRRSLWMFGQIALGNSCVDKVHDQWRGVEVNKVPEGQNVEVAVVSHGAFIMSLLGQDIKETDDAFGNAECRSFEFDDRFQLVETDESISGRKNRNLSRDVR